MSILNNSTLYPTPANVIAEMIDGIEQTNLLSWAILDPSAGDGAILDYLAAFNRWGRKSGNLYAIEIDPDLRAILNDKGYNVVDTDFLEYHDGRRFDLILINPPFDEGCKHLLHAWHISRGALIKCLLNAETLRNPYSGERKQLARLIEQYGSVKELGRCFAQADRPTQVEVVLVTLQNPQARPAFSLEYDAVKPDSLDFEALPHGLAPRDIFDSYESQFMAATAAYEELLAAKRKVAFYAQEFLDVYTPLDEVIAKTAKPNYSQSHTAFVNRLTELAWKRLFSKTKLGAITTSKVSEAIDDLQRQQGVMAFTAKNMDALFYTLALSKQTIMTECVEQVFDDLTKHYPENREVVEGWKTNSGYKVGSRFILPYMLSGSGDFQYLWNTKRLDDIDKAMCFVAGKNYEEITSITGAYSQAKSKNGGLPFGQKIYSTFFEMVLYKKGTLHFKFLDEFVREEFNRIVAENRKWLPQKAKKGAYQ